MVMLQNISWEAFYQVPEVIVFHFQDLNEDELNVSQFMGVKLGAQINPIGKIYLTPHFNIASVGFGNFNEYIGDVFNPKGNWDRRLRNQPFNVRRSSHFLSIHFRPYSF